ncbi:hypothetical protein OQA88_2522 [Cercophora sp. LCS_1]
MVADYSLSCEQVFVRSVRNLITETNELYPLLRSGELRKSSGLPTWVPDWRQRFGAESRNLSDLALDINWLKSYYHYGAASDTDPKLRRSSCQLELELQGLMVDEIHQVASYFRASGWFGNKTKESLKVVREWERLINKTWESNDYRCPYEAGYEDAFWRLMATDYVTEIRGGEAIGKRARSTDETKCRMLWSPDSASTSGVPAAVNKRFFITKKGLIGLGNTNLRAGDGVWVLLGGKMPFILRPTEEDQDGSRHYEYVTHAYVHGIMDGEVMREGREPEWITLV